MAGLSDLGGLTNSGEMPINASGGAAGDATANGKTSFNVGGLTMGGSTGISTQTLFIAGAVAVAFFYFNKK